MESNRIYDTMRCEWHNVKAAKSCKQQCAGCRLYVYIDRSKVKYENHLTILQSSNFPVILFDGSNRNQIKKAKQAVKSAFNTFKRQQTYNQPDKEQDYGLLKHKKARRRRNNKLNKRFSSKFR